MSYARFGWDGSDVYMFGTYQGDDNVVECCGCIMHNLDETSPLFTTYADLLNHISEHRKAGHHIPEDVDKRIAFEILQDPWLSAGDLDGMEKMTQDPGPRSPEPAAFTRVKEVMAELQKELDKEK